jgi:hypothetical protein
MEFRMDFVASVPGADEIRKLQLGMRWFQIGLQILPRSSFDLDNRMRSFAGGSGARKKETIFAPARCFFPTNNPSVPQSTLMQKSLQLAIRAESDLAQGASRWSKAQKKKPCMDSGSEIELAAEL